MYSSSKAYSNLLIIHISRLLTRTTLLPIQMVSNYLMNFYLFEDILTKLQRTLLKISKLGIFMFLHNILLMESFFCHQSIMISLELCLDQKIFHFFKTGLITIKKSLIKENYIIENTLHIIIENTLQFTHISYINLFYENTMSIIIKKKRNYIFLS